MCALLVGHPVVGEGKDAGVVQGGETLMRLLLLLETGDVGPEPPVNLGPLSVLVTSSLGVGGVLNVLKVAPTILQILNTNLAKRRNIFVLKLNVVLK